MDPTKFDDFTKAFATSPTRRQALQRIGGTLIAALLVPLFPGRALADGSDCDDFCDNVFGEGTPSAKQCRQDAKNHKGLCYNCRGHLGEVCCPIGTTGFCSSYSSATCCGDYQSCVNGTCYDDCFGGSCGSLEAGCHGNSNCVCYKTVEGVGFCSSPNPCSVTIGCSGSTSCPYGFACATTCCGSNPLCIPACHPSTQASLVSGQTTIGYL